jgi:ubiquinone/menaquinone biosynthesis C-methylase UbiE
MTKAELIIDLYKNLERQGPGSENDTLHALRLLNLPPVKELKIADIGCGSGGQTMTLAKNLNGHITAVDLLPVFLEGLNKKTGNCGLTEKITTIESSMSDLPFRKEEFDIIWSEGAIYNIGFENGIKKWNEYLKKGGCLAVTEITWITQNRPKEIEDYWIQIYPEIDIASNKIKILENNNYSLVGYFYLSPNSWIEEYYKPLEMKLENFLKKHKNAELAKNLVDGIQTEIAYYQKFKDYYSYGFYLAKKN